MKYIDGGGFDRYSYDEEGEIDKDGPRASVFFVILFILLILSPLLLVILIIVSPLLFPSKLKGKRREDEIIEITKRRGDKINKITKRRSR